MSENILYKFAKDLSQLYAKTRIKSVEDCFIKVAQALDSEVESWMAKAVQLGYKSSLKNPVVFDAIKELSKLKANNPGGVTPQILLKLVMDDDSKPNQKPNPLKQFLPIFVSLRSIANSTGSAILSPYKTILDATANMSGGGADTASIAEDIKSMDNMFRADMERKINSPYSEEMVGSKKKITKKEKIGNLLHYLIRRFSEEINMSSEETGQIDILGLTDDNTILRDPLKVIRILNPEYTGDELAINRDIASKILKEITSNMEPSNYDFIYNYIKSQIMLLSGEITIDEYSDFDYKNQINLHTTKSDDDFAETDEFKHSSSFWNDSDNIILLSLVLFLLGSKTN